MHHDIKQQKQLTFCFSTTQSGAAERLTTLIRICARIRINTFCVNCGPCKCSACACCEDYINEHVVVITTQCCY